MSPNLWNRSCSILRSLVLCERTGHTNYSNEIHRQTSFFFVRSFSTYVAKKSTTISLSLFFSSSNSIWSSSTVETVWTMIKENLTKSRIIQNKIFVFDSAFLSWRKWNREGSLQFFLFSFHVRRPDSQMWISLYIDLDEWIKIRLFTSFISSWWVSAWRCTIVRP